MELATFIRDSAQEILRGVRLANAGLKKDFKKGSGNYLTIPSADPSHKSGWIDFDVAVQPGEHGSLEVLRATDGAKEPALGAAAVSRLGFTLKVAVQLV